MSDTDTTTITLQHEITHNRVKYKPGMRVVVPKASAEDILRMDYDYQQYLNGLHTKHTYEVDSGTIAVGSGAE